MKLVHVMYFAFLKLNFKERFRTAFKIASFAFIYMKMFLRNAEVLTT